MSIHIPLAGPAHYKTYSMRAPVHTHWRHATCTEVQCPHEEFGWRTEILEADDLGRAQAHYIRTSPLRKFTESRRADGMTVFEFPAGQPCFNTTKDANGRVRQGHLTRLEDRPELYIVRGGDWRGDPRGETPFVHTSPESWVDDFATHQQKLADKANEG